MWFWIFTQKKQRHISKINNTNKNNEYKEMHNAQMHDNDASNALRVLQRLKEIDQGPKKYKLNHWNPSSSK